MVVLTLYLFSVPIDAKPFGANVTEYGNETAPEDPADVHYAYAGNVTEIDIFGYSTTRSWQGYFGNVSGTVQLADSNDYVMYNWSLASPEGEVYATVNGTGIDWNYIQCFNFTALGTYADDTAQAGATSLAGMNLTQLEARYGINYTDVDGVDETFDLDGSLPNNDGTHDLFYTNNRYFSDGECLSANIFDDTFDGVDNHFEEVLLYEPVSTAVIFTALLEEADTAGFDTELHDFQMLVLENGHGVDQAVTTYYFYVELE